MDLKPDEYPGFLDADSRAQVAIGSEAQPGELKICLGIALAAAALAIGTSLGFWW